MGEYDTKPAKTTARIDAASLELHVRPIAVDTRRSVSVDRGRYHAYAHRGQSHWRVGETSGTIVLTAWEALRPLPEAERDEWLGAIRRKLPAVGGM